MNDQSVASVHVRKPRVTVTTARFSRLSHLIGSVVLLALGVVMALRPDLLG